MVYLVYLKLWLITTQEAAPQLINLPLKTHRWLSIIMIQPGKKLKQKVKTSNFPSRERPFSQRCFIFLSPLTPPPHLLSTHSAKYPSTGSSGVSPAHSRHAEHSGFSWWASPLWCHELESLSVCSYKSVRRLPEEKSWEIGLYLWSIINKYLSRL